MMRLGLKTLRKECEVVVCNPPRSCLAAWRSSHNA